MLNKIHLVVIKVFFQCVSYATLIISIIKVAEIARAANCTNLLLEVDRNNKNVVAPSYT